MGSPNTSLATLRPELGLGRKEFNAELDRQGFIGMRVLPVREVPEQSGPFGKLTIEEILKNAATERTGGAGYSRSKWTFGTDSYATKEQGHEVVLDNREANMYRNFFDHEQICTARALDVVLRNAERRIADAVFNATTWTGSTLTTAVGTPWSTTATANPRADVKAAKQKVWNLTGVVPNTLIIAQEVFENLLDCTLILDRLKYAGFTDPRPGMITEDAVAQALGIGKLLVSGSPKNTAQEGQSASLAPIWSTARAMVACVAQTDDPSETCIGRVLHWGEDGSTVGGTVETYRDEVKRADIVRCRHDVQEKIMLAAAGHLLTNIT